MNGRHIDAVSSMIFRLQRQMRDLERIAKRGGQWDSNRDRDEWEAMQENLTAMREVRDYLIEGMR